MTAAAPVRVAVIGAGLIGRRHIEHVACHPAAALAAIVDPGRHAEALAARYGVPWFADLASMLVPAGSGGAIEAAIVATPNLLHLEHALACVEAGIPALIEKPLAHDLAAAERIVAAGEAAGVALLTGHHRRHNPLIHAAHAAIRDGRLGRIVAVHAACWVHKPAGYFEADWRRQPGAGPVLLNLIHDIDLLRLLVGDVESVHALESSATRGHQVEDTAAILLRFRNGALGTVTLSDAVSAPWSWELTSGENPAYTQTSEAALTIGGTLASLAIPTLDLWHHDPAPDWMSPLRRSRLHATPADPLALQVQNLCEVARGTAAPVMTARDGMETLRVVLAIKQAAADAAPVHLPLPAGPVSMPHVARRG